MIYPVSQYRTDRLGIAIYSEGQLADPDNSVVSYEITRDDAQVNIGEAEREEEGLFTAEITAEITKTRGIYEVKWEYTIGGAPFEFVSKFQVVPPMDTWDNLTEEEQNIVFGIWSRLSNTYDSARGGPHLWEEPQNNPMGSGNHVFEDIAQRFNGALTYINFTHQPVFNPPFDFGRNARRNFPEKFAGLLEHAVYVETLKHLSRSYIEQPQVQGVQTAMLNRQQYRDQWQREYQQEKDILDSMVRQLKRKYLLGTTRSMVLGGIRFDRHMAPTRPHYRYTLTR